MIEAVNRAFEFSPIGMAVIANNGNILRVNKSFCEILEYKEQDLVSKSFFNVVSADDSAEETERLKRCLKGESAECCFEKKCYTKNGKVVWIILHVFVGEDISGTPLYYIGQLQNITVSKVHQDVEKLSYAIFHDLREPLRTISGFTELLEDTQKERVDDAGKEYIKHINLGINRLRLLLDDVLVYSGLQTVESIDKVNVDLNEVMEEVKESCHSRLEETGGEVVWKDLPIVKSTYSLMFGVLMNLIVNGIKFHKAEERPLVQVAAKDMGAFWEISVSDNGIGINCKYFNEIFEIFHRLQDKRIEGTGIGLSICKRIIEGSGGDIWVKSQVGNGSTFFFSLPKTANKTAKREKHDKG